MCLSSLSVGSTDRHMVDLRELIFDVYIYTLYKMLVKIRSL